MKKHFAILLITLIPASSYAQITFTEIMYDLPGSDENREWVEIHNDGPVYDLTNWKFFEGDTNHGLTNVAGESTFGTGDYAVIADDANQFLVDSPGFQGKLFDSSFSLSNTGETIAIKYPNGDIATEITYSSSQGGAGDGNSLQYSGSEWVAATSTPGQTP